MSTKPRLPAANLESNNASDPNFASVMAHCPDILSSFFELYAAFWQSGSVPVQHKEMARLRNARVTDCGY